MMKFDKKLLFSNDYMKKQIDVNPVVHKRKKLPNNALHLWKYNRMRQKGIFSEPLVHGMCTDLHDTCKTEFPQIQLPEEAVLGLNELPQEAALGLNELPQEAGLGLNELPEEAGLGLNELPEEADLGLNELLEEAGLDLNELPEEAGLDLNELPQAGGIDLDEIPQAVGLNLDEIPQAAGLNLDDIPQAAGLNLNELPEEAGLNLNELLEEAGLNLDAQEEDAPNLDAQEEEEEEEEEDAPGGGPKPELTNEQRFGVYFALEVIRVRDGAIQMDDKHLIACLLNTSVRTVERIWAKAVSQIERNEEVDVSNKKKGNVGRKQKELDLPSVTTIPLNKRRTIMIGVMEDGGGNGYEISHNHKERLQAEGRLPLSLTITQELVEKTNALIEEMEFQLLEV